MGILEDVLLQVGQFFSPCDFMVMKVEEDAQILIILGRPFLTTAGAMIDVKNGKLSLQVGGNIFKFNLTQAMSSPTLEDACYRVDILERVLIEEMSLLNPP